MAIIIIGKSGRISILKRCLSVWKQRTQRRPRGVISARTAKLLNEYLHETEECGNEYVFLTYEGEKIGEATVRDNMRVYGQVAKITNKRVSPHTIRHTGALFYILNGGDPFSLQRILGHSHMNMVRRYVQMTNMDVQNEHSAHSPLNYVFK